MGEHSISKLPLNPKLAPSLSTRVTSFSAPHRYQGQAHIADFVLCYPLDFASFGSGGWLCCCQHKIVFHEHRRFGGCFKAFLAPKLAPIAAIFSCRGPCRGIAAEFPSQNRSYWPGRGENPFQTPKTPEKCGKMPKIDIKFLPAQNAPNWLLCQRTSCSCSCSSSSSSFLLIWP